MPGSHQSDEMPERNGTPFDQALARRAATAPGGWYLTKEEAAQLARCHPSTIARHIRSGEIPAFRPGGNRILIRDDDLRAWIESQPVVEKRTAPTRRPPRARRSNGALPGPGSVEALRRIEKELDGRA